MINGEDRGQALTEDNLIHGETERDGVKTIK
jgi:hypothetical protein